MYLKDVIKDAIKAAAKRGLSILVFRGSLETPAKITISQTWSRGPYGMFRVRL